jgi:hypothetical protein
MPDTAELKYPETWITESNAAQKLLGRLHSCRRQLLSQIGIRNENTTNQIISVCLTDIEGSEALCESLIKEIAQIKNQLLELMNLWLTETKARNRP